MSQIELRGVSKQFSGPPPVLALREVALDIEPGEWVSIVGPSGGGKSTLLNVIGLLDAPTSGVYLLDSKNSASLSERQRSEWRSSHLGFVFQNFHLLDRRPVVDSVELGLLYRGLTSSDRRRMALAALSDLGMRDTAFQIANTLSGGQRQRVAIARALAMRAPILVADEPTGNLDSANAAFVVRALQQLHARGTTIVLVTHSVEIAKFADRSVHIQDGRITLQSSEFSGGKAIALLSSREHTSAVPSSVPGRDSRLRLPDLLNDAIASLRSRRVRSGTLIATIAIAVSLVTATVGVSQSASAQVSETFDAFTSRDVSITWSQAGDSIKGPRADDPTMLDRLRAIAGVDSAAVVSEYGEAVVSVNSSRPGLRPALFGMNGQFIEAGRVDVRWSREDRHDVESGEVIVGSLLADQLQLGPIWSEPTIIVGGDVVSVVGLIEASPRNPAMKGAVVLGSDDVEELRVTKTAVWLLATPGAAQQVASQAPYAVDPYSPEALEVSTPPDPSTLRGQIEAGVATTLIVVTLVTLLAAIAALVSAMLMAVNERRSELGLRRALGARPIHIRALVVVEALVLGLVGGIVGLAGGLLSVLFVTAVQGWIPTIDLVLGPLAVGVGMIVGVLSGALATTRAAKISPIDALRI